MLRSSHRLNKDLFNKVFNEGKILRTKNFTVRMLKDPTLMGLFAVSASKKDFKTAVSRNRIRRRIYEIIRVINKDSKGISQSAIFFPKKTAEKEETSLLKTEIAGILN